MKRCLLILCSCALLSGCGVVSPEVPAGFVAAPEPRAPLADPAAAMRNGFGQLQVIICYGPVLATHTAIRLIDPGGDVVYWDPGGEFGDDTGDFHRRRDVIVNPAPQVEDLWLYRQRLRNHALLLFEWDLPADHVTKMQRTLIHGSTRPFDMGAYDTDGGAGGCGLAVGGFLILFASPPLSLPRLYRYPHELARHLWTQQPSRVWLYEKDKPTQFLNPTRSLP